MHINCQMFTPQKSSHIIGAIKVSEEEIILIKKSKFVAYGFGAVGAIISAKLKGKEFHRISFRDVLSIEMKKFKLNKKACYIKLKDESEYIFKFPNPENNIVSIQQIFKESKNHIL